MNQHEVFPNARIAQWIVLAAMVFTTPVFYYMFVTGGWVSYAGLVKMTAQHIAYPFIMVTIMNFLHLAVYGALLYLMSGAITRAVYRHAGRYAGRWLVAVVVILLGVGLLPVFGVNHGASGSQNAYMNVLTLKP